MATLKPARGTRKSATKNTTTAARAGRPRKKGAPRSFRLDPDLLAEARRELGTSNDTETIEAALDLVVFRREVLAGVDALRHMHFEPFDRDEA